MLEDRTSLTVLFQRRSNARAIITLLGIAQRFVFELGVELLAVRKREGYRFAIYTAHSLGRRCLLEVEKISVSLVTIGRRRRACQILVVNRMEFACIFKLTRARRDGSIEVAGLIFARGFQAARE